MTSKRKDIYKLLRYLNPNINSGESAFHSYMSQIPDSGLIDADTENALFKELDFEVLNDMMIDVYARHFTHDEILEMIIFYESPVGMKFSKLIPRLAIESIQAGEKWSDMSMANLENNMLNMADGIIERSEPRTETRSEVKSEGNGKRAARIKFVDDYIAGKEWDTDTSKLSIEQIIEIRDQDGWKNPIIDD